MTPKAVINPEWAKAKYAYQFQFNSHIHPELMGFHIDPHTGMWTNDLEVRGNEIDENGQIVPIPKYILVE